MSKHLVITGGTSGIGKAAVKSLIDEDWKITLLARNIEKAKEFGSDLVSIISCDLSDLKSVKTASDQLIDRGETIDVLMNNAGGVFQKKESTKNGFEMTFGVNHLSHYLLTTQLMDLLLKSKTRVINVSSSAHRLGKLDFEDLQWEKRKYNPMKAYGDGKLCNIYFTQELHNRFHQQGLTSYACHPGVVRTNFGLDTTGVFNILVKVAQPFMITPEKGAMTQLYLATNDQVEKHSGRYFDKRKVASISPQAKDSEAASHLWEISEQLVEEYR